MIQQHINGIPGIVREAIVKIDKGARVILFGSKARDESHQNSDWDFLILIKNPASDELHDEIREQLYSIELSTGEVISSIIESEQGWLKYMKSEFYRNVSREGVEIV